MTIIEQIKAEIERRIKENESWKDFHRSKGNTTNFDDVKIIELQSLLSFLSTLESEKPMNPDGLENEIKRYLREEHDRDTTVGDVARHFAQWGAEHFRDTTKKIEPPCHTVEEWIEHIKNADQLTKDIFSKGPYNVLYDALNHPYQYCYDAIKEFGELCYASGLQDKQEHSSVPNDLEKAAEKSLRLAGFHNMETRGMDWKGGFTAGAEWQAEQFEKNRLASCDNMSEEEYDRETDFVESIIEKEHRQPTFSDAINYGMRLQKEQTEKRWLEDRDGCFWDGVNEGKKAMKEQMMKEAVEGRVSYFESRDVAVIYYDDPKGNTMCLFAPSSSLETGDKVRIIVCKNED